MKSNRTRCTLGDVLMLQRGFDLPAAQRKPGNVPIYASTGVAGFHDEAAVQGPGVVIGRSGSIGGGQYAVGPYWPLNTTLWVKDFKGNDPLFCYYLLKNIDFVPLNVGGAVPTLNRNHAHLLEVSRPSLQEQTAIAAVLGALDDRIENLRATNETLEAITQALFKSWFVDFDPVKAKAAGEAPVGMDPETAALFPTEFEESAMGLIPKGWVQEPFSHTVNILGGSTPKTTEPSYWDGPLPWFSVVDAPTPSNIYVIDTQKHISQVGLNSTAKKLLPVGTTIISARGTVGKVALTGRPMAMNQSCYGLRGKAGDVYFTYFATRNIVATLQGLAHGSVFDTITTKTFDQTDLVTPSREIIQAFEIAAASLMSLILCNVNEMAALKPLRDTLLPKLISGELRLPGFETTKT